MSNILRAIQGLAASRNEGISKEQLAQLLFQLTGQRSNLSEQVGAESIGDPAGDYLDSPAMAETLLKNAKAMTVHDLLKQARAEGGNPNMAPMIASIQQLDR